ncbi:MAG: hypothetical protein HC849_29195 [Oscillatoriales cyanobacterium RU_3_3]|nr:hypothetical protein [Oscillatoriales cyanobacterium RU_3_3]
MKHSGINPETYSRYYRPNASPLHLYIQLLLLTGYQLSTVNCQLSTVNYQLSNCLTCQLSTINCQLT